VHTSRASVTKIEQHLPIGVLLGRASFQLYDVDNVLEFSFGSDSVFAFVATQTCEDVSSVLIAAHFAEPLLSG
jgi:hypothetical protein